MEDLWMDGWMGGTRQSVAPTYSPPYYYDYDYYYYDDDDG